MRTDGDSNVSPKRVTRNISLLRRCSSAVLQAPTTTAATAIAWLSATLVAALLLITGHGLGNAWIVSALALAAVAGERGRLKVGDHSEISISLLPALFAAVLLGPLPAMVIYGASMLAKPSAPLPARLFYIPSRALVGALTGLVALAAAQIASSDAAEGIVLAAGASGVVAEVSDLLVLAIAYRVRRGGRILGALREFGPVAFAAIPFYTSVVALLALAYTLISPLSLPLFLVPAAAAQRWFVLYQQERRLSADLATANQQLERANLSFAGALVATLDARDRYTAGHSAAVAVYARDVAERLGLPEREQQLAHLAGLVHDIGKIGLPAGLLEKPGALTLEERRRMEQHPVIGERILINVDSYAEIASIVRHHHERVDGQGYPDGLAGDDIPLLARIIAVADAYNAMTSDRPYRDAMPTRIARLRLAQAVDSQFDTAVVAAFEAVLATAPESYRTGQHPDFRFDLQSEDETLETGSYERAAVAVT